MPSLISGRIYIFDVESDPRAPQIHKVLYQSNQSFNIPPLWANPWAFEFLDNFCQIPPPSRDRSKAVQMPHHTVGHISGDQMPPPPGKLPDYCFNFSVASNASGAV